MDLDPKVPPYHTSDKYSFAQPSVTDRWPVIITGGIDDVHRTNIKTTDPEVETEGKKIISQLAELKYELQHDRHLKPLPADMGPDIAGYNEELEKLGTPTWHNVPWLFAECYLYRRIATIFSQSPKWKHHDIFARQKLSTFKSSRPAVLELASRYRSLTKEIEDQKGSHSGDKSSEEIEKAERMLFFEMCEICLWGNATDLSLLTNISYEDIQKLQGSEARNKSSEENIVVNDLPAAFEVLNRLSRDESKKGKERRVDIVLDNAGFELFVDLVLAGYLLTADLATMVVLHPKNIPWFVSDVIPKDFTDLLNIIADPQPFYSNPSEDEKQKGETPPPLSEAEVADLKFLFERWSGFHEDGRIVIRPNAFWTEGGSYWRMPRTAPDLHEDLKESELVIHKGDLNYRKLTADVAWDPTTPFAKAIGPLGEPSSGIRTLALRTCKADVVVGLPEGEDERLRKTEGGGGDSGMRKWAWSGKWAVVQFHDGKKGT
jgi:hypothetical protein